MTKVIEVAQAVSSRRPKLRRRTLLLELGGLLGATVLQACAPDESGELTEPTANVAAAISDQLAQGETVRLTPGATYLLSTPIVLASGARILGDDFDPPILVPAADFVGLSGDPDDPSNALIVGTSAAGFTTVVRATAYKDNTSVQVDDPAGIVVGEWIRISGANPVGDMAYASDGSAVIKRELARVVDVVGSLLELESPLMQQHGPGSAVEVVMPLEDLVIQHIQLDGSGAAIACGIAVADSVRAAITVGVRGFSRAGVNLLGSKDAVVEVEGLGGCNSVVLFDSVVTSTILVTSRSGVARTHPLGIPRGMITLRHRCASVTIADSILAAGCTGISLWGGTGITVRDTEIRDMRLDERAARDPSIPRSGGAAFSAAGIEVGAFWSPSPDAENGYGLVIRDVNIDNCRHPDADVQSAVLLVDQHGFAINGLSITNVGVHASTPGNFMGGLALYDTFDGVIDALTLHGVIRPLRFSGNWVRCDIGDVDVSLVDALGDNYTPIISLHCANPATMPSRIRIQRLTGNSTSAVLETGGNFSASMAAALNIESLNLDSRDYGDVILASNWTEPAHDVGAVVQLTSSADGALAVITPTDTDPGDKVAVVNGRGLGFNPGTGWLLVSRGSKRAVKVRSVDQVVAGDTLVIVPGLTELAVDNSGLAGAGIGVAMLARDKGGTGLVPVA